MATDRATSDQPLAGRYRLGRVLGSGGGGIVREGEDMLLRRRVAIKEVRLPPLAPQRERDVLGQRVLREARAAARLHHPGVVTVYDVIEADDHPWIVMEYVDGSSLADIVRDSGPIPPARAARIGVSLAYALEAAHAAGVVHRDVKPANVLVTAAGQARLTDFGIAVTEGDSTLTGTGMLVGSPAYIAPERARGAKAGPAGDIWGLGATLFAAVEGEAPYAGEGPIAVLAAVVEDRRRPFRHAGPLREILVALLESDPLRRPSLPEVRGRLRELAERDEPDQGGKGGSGGKGGPGAQGGKAPARRPGAAAAALPVTEPAPTPEVAADAAAVAGMLAERPARADARRARGGASEPAAGDSAGAGLGSGGGGAGRDDASRDDAAGGATLRAAAAAVPVPTETASPRAPDPRTPDPRTPDPRTRATPGTPEPSTPRAGRPSGLHAPAGLASSSRPEPSPPPGNRSIDAAGGGGPGVRRRRMAAPLAGAGVVLVAVVVTLTLLLTGGGSPSAPAASASSASPSAAQPGPVSASAGPSSPAPAVSGPTPGRPTSAPASPAPAGSGGGGASDANLGALVPSSTAPAPAPAGFTSHRDATGWSIAVPTAWRGADHGNGEELFTAPSGYPDLLVDTKARAGASAIGAWTDLERSLRSTTSGYRRLSIRPADGGDGTNAAIWEFTYTSKGQTIHQFEFDVVRNGHGYGLRWRAPEAQWNGQLAQIRQVIATLRPGA